MKVISVLLLLVFSSAVFSQSIYYRLEKQFKSSENTTVSVYPQYWKGSCHSNQSEVEVGSAVWAVQGDRLVFLESADYPGIDLNDVFSSAWANQNINPNNWAGYSHDGKYLNFKMKQSSISTTEAHDGWGPYLVVRKKTNSTTLYCILGDYYRW